LLVQGVTLLLPSPLVRRISRHLGHPFTSVASEWVAFGPDFGYSGISSIVHAHVGSVVKTFPLVASYLNALILVRFRVLVEDFLNKVVDQRLLDVVLIRLHDWPYLIPFMGCS